MADDDTDTAVARAAWRALPVPMARALELAWESTRAGSLGIGATISAPDGTIVATGRNRLVERDPGDDHLAGTSLAHAEMNALAKLQWGARAEPLTLWTTLQPCLQCIGAIRMSRVARVQVLAPDPLFRELERLRDLSPFIARDWPEHARHDADAIAAFALLLPTHLSTFWGAPQDEWARALPETTELARSLVASSELVDHAGSGRPVDEVIAALWDRLVDCVHEIDALWSLG
jgi:tRNA(Arg) A34 adenosine deaminase TadA